MAEYIKRDSIIGLAHKMQFGRILTDREAEVVEMVVNSVSDDARVDLVRCGECKYCLQTDEFEYWCHGFCSPARLVREEDFCSHGERKGGADGAADN